MSNGRIHCEPGDDDIYVVQIEGDFDAAMRDEGIACTDEALDAHPKALLIDVKRCTFLDSTAIAVILGARQRAIADGISFALVGHNPTIDRTLELTGLAEELKIVSDREEAIASFLR
jgi:anti-anti-sigma factor